MTRFWNLKSQFVAVLVLLLLGALALQMYVRELRDQRLFDEMERVLQAVVDDTSTVVQEALAQARPPEIAAAAIAPPSRSVRSPRPPRNTARAASRSPINDRKVLVRVALLRRAARNPEEERALEEANRQIIARIQEVLRQANSAQAPSVPERNLDLEPVSIGASPAPGFDALPIPDGPDVDRIAGVPIATEVVAGDAAASSDDGVEEDDPDLDIPPAPTSDVEIDIRDHFASLRDVIDRHQRLSLIATIGIFVCGIAGALYLSVRITRPVYEFVDVFDRVSDGDLDARVTRARTGEFTILADQFNRMVDQLRENRDLDQELARRERVQHMGDLAAGVAHDIRNPLNAIHLTVGQMRDEFLPEGDEPRKRFLRFTTDMQSEVVRLNRLVTNFLSLAQPSATSTEPVRAGELIEELRRLLEPEVNDRGVELSVEIDPYTETFEWDRQEMKSAFLNVAMNALQAMERGGMLTIGVRSATTTEPACIEFVDTGCGIATEDLDRLFVPYFTKRKGGTGLGLAITKRIAERNGAELSVSSEIGVGTTVRFCFPEETLDTEADRSNEEASA